MTDRQDQLDEFAKNNGHPPVAEGIVCVDFDATIRAWGGLFEFPKPFEGFKEWARDIRSRGYSLIIFTSRLSPTWHIHEGRDPKGGIREQIEYLEQYFKVYNIEVDGYTGEKIPALIYIDDKAVRYTNWRDVSEKFEMFVGGKFVG